MDAEPISEHLQELDPALLLQAMAIVQRLKQQLELVEMAEMQSILSSDPFRGGMMELRSENRMRQILNRSRGGSPSETPLHLSWSLSPSQSDAIWKLMFSPEEQA